mgnify:FL=1
MKKFLVLCLMVLFVGGCGSKDNLTNIDISQASVKLDEKYTNMVDMDDKELSIVYGLDVSLLEEYEIKSSQLMNGNFYAILKVSDKNMDTVRDQMDNLFSVLESQSNLYSPDAVKLIKNHLETEVGNYLIYIVAENSSSIYDDILDTMK